MKATMLKGFEMLAESLESAKRTISITYRNGSQEKTIECDYNPLTGSVHVGAIVVPLSELAGQLKFWYKVELVRID